MYSLFTSGLKYFLWHLETLFILRFKFKFYTFIMQFISNIFLIIRFLLCVYNISSLNVMICIRFLSVIYAFTSFILYVFSSFLYRYRWWHLKHIFCDIIQLRVLRREKELSYKRIRSKFGGWNWRSWKEFSENYSKRKNISKKRLKFVRR